MRTARVGCCALIFVMLAATADDGPAPARPLLASPDNGWVMFSMTATGPVKAIFIPALHYRGRGNSTQGKIDGAHSKLRKDTPKLPRFAGLSQAVLTRDDPLGSIKLQELPAGDYEFYAYTGYDSNVSLQSSDGFRVPFTVTAGQINYLGNLNFSIESEWSGHSGHVNFDISDMMERDLKLFRGKFTLHAQVPVQGAVPGPTP
jgi:hypothetical protein